MKINFGKRYTTYMGLLVKVLEMSDGDVVELGAGIYSTPLLHWLCRDMNRRIISYENDQEYYNFAKQYQSRLHRIRFVDSWDKIDTKTHCGVVFIDHMPSIRRSKDAIRFKDSADYIVLHDTEGDAYGYEDVWPYFKYKYTWKEAKGWVSVVSNFKDLSLLESNNQKKPDESIPPEYGTHLSALIKVINITNGPVLELGTGVFSTPYLHYVCYPNRRLVSYESKKDYYNKFISFAKGSHEINFVKNWDEIDLSGHWSVVLVDHEPVSRRKEEIKRLAWNADYIVVHDSNPKLDKKYKYSQIYPLFKYHKDFTDQKPYTSVLSNFKDLSNLELGQLSINPSSNFNAQGEKITRIVGFQSGHDVAYCILENGIPVIHEEMERITRKKMEKGDGLKFFFSRASNYDHIKHFTFGNWGGRSGRYQKQYFNKESENKMNKILSKNDGRYYEFGHHTSHAANAFYTSNFERALIITVDGGGWEEGYVSTALTISEGVGNKIKSIKIFDKNGDVNLGRIYNKSTRYIFHLSVGYPKGDQAGTVMAMATLGEPKYTDMFSDFDNNWHELRRIAKMSEQEKFNVAASLQQYTEQTFHKYVSKYINEGDYENLCLSGGVSLNCVMLGKIKNWFPKIKNIFCDPVPYDAGLAIGSARYLWHHVLGYPRIKNNIQNMSPYLGVPYSKSDIEKVCKQFRNKIHTEKVKDEDVLEKINLQKIVAVFGGGSESGRRALGNRSILADPRNLSMKAQVNEKIKHRAWFRPVAPSILEEKVGEWFVEPILSPYMTFAIKVKAQLRDKIPAVVHYDGTGRLQTVNKDLSPWYYGFIKKWEKKTGIPILINTSFNDSEPIVETPEDALKCFLGTDIDYLYFFDYGMLISKIWPIQKQ